MIFFPKNLDIDAVLKNIPPVFQYHPEDFIYIVGTIIRLRVQYKDNMDSEFVPLNAQVLQSRIRNYNNYIKYLIENGIIETDNHYIPGEKSRGYKLTKKYAESEYDPIPLKKRSLVVKRREEKAEERSLEREYGHLTKWFNSNLKIDRQAALRRLIELLRKEENEGVTNAYERFYCRLASVDALNNGVYHLNVDNTAFRFHSNLTNLKSELRNYITYGRSQLCSVDIKNSQPFLSTILFNPEFYTKSEKSLTLYSISRGIYNTLTPIIPAILSILSGIDSIIMLVKSDVTQCSTDIERYCTQVDKGRLYDYMSEQSARVGGRKLDVTIPEEKKILKEAMFVTLFSDNRFIGQPEAEMKRFFRELFPTVYMVFNLLKGKGNELLPIILQLVESEIVLKRAARRIGRTYSDLPIFTIHDSIVTISGHQEMVRQVLKEEFEQAISLQPSLSIEMWGE